MRTSLPASLLNIAYLCAAYLCACAIGGQAQIVPVPAPGNVTLSLDEYDRLNHKLAARPATPRDVAPFPHVVRSANLDLRVTADSVIGSVNLEGEVLTPGDRKVPLLTGMVVLEAQQRGKDLPLERQGSTHSAVLTGPGDFNVTLTAALPLTIETGRASFILPVPAAGAARLTLTLPGEQTQVNLTPGIVTSRVSQNGQTVIEATLVPSSNATLWWAGRLNSVVAPAAPKEVRFLSDLHTLISATETELSVAVLAQATVVQGEPTEFRLTAPAGYEWTGASGATLDTSEMKGSDIILHVANPQARNHEFLVTLARASANLTKAEIPLPTFAGAQRETGEVLVESDGAMELAATPQGGLRRMDLKELSPSLRALSRGTLQAAFRYQTRPTEMPGLAMDWVRFSDSRVLSAVAQHAEATTLVTIEGRSITEIKLTVKNQSQPFIKVELPAGASILSAEVAGEKVKPVQGTDGSRVPLLRTGFRPTRSYVVSFVVLNPESALARKGNAGLSLPKMDLPIGKMDWEVFLPEQLRVSNFGGDVQPEQLFPASENDYDSAAYEVPGPSLVNGNSAQAIPGLLSGKVVDQSGSAVTSAQVSVESFGRTYTAVTTSEGIWTITSVPTGPIQVRVAAPGFKLSQSRAFHDSSRGTALTEVLEVGSAVESVTVSAEVSQRLQSNVQVNANAAMNTNAQQAVAQSANVGELQRKVVGVLPIAIQIPRTGVSYRFVRPLVVEEETKLTFQYRRK